MKILAYGGGINSTAILALIKLNRYLMPEHIIFCDTGAERSDTMCYLKYIQQYFKIEIIKSKFEGLIEYSNKYKILPSRQVRWCTEKFKIIPMNEYIKSLGITEYTKILGIDYGEQHRVKDLTCEYPLIDLKMNREKCIEIIKEAGFHVPKKSGCYICPFMRMSELKQMFRENKEEFKILQNLEKQANKRNNKIYFKLECKRFVGDLVRENIDDLFDSFDNYQGCLCKYD